jgi:hypothetical protein
VEITTDENITAFKRSQFTAYNGTDALAVPSLLMSPTHCWLTGRVEKKRFLLSVCYDDAHLSVVSLNPAGQLLASPSAPKVTETASSGISITSKCEHAWPFFNLSES